MALTQSFTCTQIIGKLGTIVFTDTSTGSDSNITEKHIYLTKENGEYLKPEGSTTDYIVWPTATNPFELDILDKDMALEIEVDWIGSQVPTTGMIFLHDASLGTTGTSTVSVWEDQGTGGRDLTAQAGEEPQLVTNITDINGNSAISSYGRLAKMSTSGNFPDISTGGTIVMVAKQSSVNGATNSDNGGVFIGAGSLVDMQIRRGNTSTGPLVSIRGGINASTFAITTDVVPDDTFVTICLRNDGTNNYISVNGGTEGSASANGTGYIAIPLEVFKTTSGAQGNKQIAWQVGYSRTLTTNEITALKLYLRTRFEHY